jgi:hydroxypyruvate reductase
MLKAHEHRSELERLWQVGVSAVRGDAAVMQSLSEAPIPAPDRILAVGKAAGAMASAACAQFPGVPCLVVTKDGHGGDAPKGAHVLEAAHPVPDARSLAAGAALRAAVAESGASVHLLMLVSGGASSLAEDLPDGMTLDDLTGETQALLASGADIHAMNARRKEISQIKGGKRLGRFPGARITALALSDVEGDALSVIGSGIGDAPQSPGFTARIVASNAIARAAIAADRTPVQSEECLYADVTALAPVLAGRLTDGAPGLYVWGGEPTVVLPDNPGKGGRNMALALMMAREIRGLPIALLVAGTDGTDGPTDGAGAFVTGETWEDSAESALARADAYPWLAERGCLFKPGPTGTNVMDVALALKLG